MQLKLKNIKGKTVAELISDTIEINDVQDAIDLLGNASYMGTGHVKVNEMHMHPNFFNLKTGLAGEILQKFSNYDMKLTIEGDFSKYQSKSLKDFIFESNRMGRILFVHENQDNGNNEDEKYFISGKLNELIDRAISGKSADIDYILNHLNQNVTIAITKFVDYSLGLVTKELGIQQVKYYLFHGTQIQRNYSSLFFNRRGDWKIVKEAYEKGLIDEIQAYAR